MTLAKQSSPASALTSPAEAPATLSQMSSWFPGVLHLGLLGLLLAEVALVRGRFNTDRVLGDGGLPGQLLLATRNAAPVGIAALGALVLFGWRALAREHKLLKSAGQSPARAVVGCLLHGLVFAGFYGLTQRTFASRETGNTAGSFLWAAAWVLGAFAVPLTAACIAFRPTALLASLRRLLPTFLLATGIGAFAFMMSRLVFDSGLWHPIHVATTKLARGLLSVATGETAAEEEPFVLSAGSFRVLVNSQCSGFEGVALIGTFLAAYFVLFRRSLRFPHVLVLLPVAALIEWFTNAVRLATLVWIGGRVSPEIALSGFHSYAGWVAFCALSVAVVYASRKIRWFAKPALASQAAASPVAVAPQPGHADTVNPAAVYLGPFLAILAASFITGAFSKGFDVAYPVRVLAGLVVLWCVRSELPRLGRAVHWTGLAYGGAAFLILLALERLGMRPPESGTGQGLDELSPWAARSWLAFRGLGFLIVAPLAEELAFRGFLARRLVGSDFEAVSYRAITPLAWCLSSVAFGLLHGQWVPATIAGALFGLAAIQRGRLGDAITAHATTNALLLLSSMVLGPWHRWL